MGITGYKGWRHGGHRRLGWGYWGAQGDGDGDGDTGGTGDGDMGGKREGDTGGTGGWDGGMGGTRGVEMGDGGWGQGGTEGTGIRGAQGTWDGDQGLQGRGTRGAQGMGCGGHGDEELGAGRDGDQTGVGARRSRGDGDREGGGGDGGTDKAERGAWPSVRGVVRWKGRGEAEEWAGEILGRGRARGGAWPGRTARSLALPAARLRFRFLLRFPIHFRFRSRHLRSDTAALLPIGGRLPRDRKRLLAICFRAGGRAAL